MEPQNQSKLHAYPTVHNACELKLGQQNTDPHISSGLIYSKPVDREENKRWFPSSEIKTWFKLTIQIKKQKMLWVEKCYA